jgi:hypothetical protein
MQCLEVSDAVQPLYGLGVKGLKVRKLSEWSLRWFTFHTFCMIFQRSWPTHCFSAWTPHLCSCSPEEVWMNFVSNIKYNLGLRSSGMLCSVCWYPFTDSVLLPSSRVRMATIGCYQTSLNNYQHTLRITHKSEGLNSTTAEALKCQIQFIAQN